MKSATATFFAAALLAALAGCVNQKAEVARYRKVLDGNDPAAAVTLADGPGATLTLEDALRIANADNEQLQIAGEDYVQALIDKARAAETFLPSISLAPSMTRQEDFAFPNVGGSSKGGSSFANVFPQNFSDVPINTSVKTSLVRDIYDVSRADKTAEGRKAALLDLQSTVLLNVGQTYYGILTSEQAVRTLTISVALQEARVKNVTDRFKQGVARALDVAQSEADAAATRVQLTDAKNNVVKGRATLARLLGRAVVEASLVDHFAPPAASENVEGMLHIARAKRQDLVAAAQEVNASGAAVRSAWGQYAPSLSVNLNTFLYRESFPSDSWWNAMFSLNLPIFEEGIIHNNVRAAYSRLRQSVSRARLADAQVNEEVRTAMAEYEATNQRLEDLATETAAAQRAYATATHSFTAGAATNLDVLTSQDSQLSSQLRFDSENFNHKVAYLNLLRVTGRLNREAIEQLAAQPMAGGGGLSAPIAAPVSANAVTTTTITTTTVTTSTTTTLPPPLPAPTDVPAPAESQPATMP